MSSVTNSPGTMADDSAVGTISWTNPNNAKVSDNVYATVVTNLSKTTHYLKATNFGFSIPSGATINGILVEIERKKTASGAQTCKDSEVKIVKADGTIGSTNKGLTSTDYPTSDTYQSYGSSSDLWDEIWDDTKINDIDFGVVLSSIFIGDGDSAATPLVDHIRITVYYTETASGATMTGVQSITGVGSITLQIGINYGNKT